MTIITTVLALTLLASLAAGVAISRQHAQRIDRLVGMLLTERASSDQRIYQLLERQAKPHPDLTELISLVDRLCQRLQAPEVAIVDHQFAQPLPPSPPALMPDDDDAFWKAQEPMTKEALADAVMAAETHG